jgi:tetratricopeptide (TPR) repeat protein
MKYLFSSILLIAATAPALAQEGSEPPISPDATVDAAELDQAARILFDAGTRAYEAGLFEEALTRYTNAYELSHRPELLYNIAVSHDRLEQKHEAADFYARFVEAVPDSPRIGIARSRAEILQRSVDEEAVRAAAYENARADNSDSPGNEAPPDVEGSRSLAGPIASFAIAGAGLVTFAVSGLIAGSRFRDADVTCSTGCDEAQLDSVDTAALVADIGLGIAIAGAAVGVVWLLVGGSGDDQRAHVSPVVSPQVAGLEFAGSF